jgi:hypothetical protein
VTARARFTSTRERLTHALAELLAEADPGRGSYSIQLGSDRVAEVTIEIRRVAGAARFDLRAEAEAYLTAHPSRADECGCETNAPRGSWTRSSRCTKSPTIAVERATAEEAASFAAKHSGYEPTRFVFVCATHARKLYLERRTVTIAAERLKQARREAERERNKIRAEEDAKITADALTRPCPFCHAIPGARCVAPRPRGPRLVRAEESGPDSLPFIHAHRQGNP